MKKHFNNPLVFQFCENAIVCDCCTYLDALSVYTRSEDNKNVIDWNRIVAVFITLITKSISHGLNIATIFNNIDMCNVM